MTRLGGVEGAEVERRMGGRPRRCGWTGEVPGAKVTRLGGVGEVPGGEVGRLVDALRAGGGGGGGVPRAV